VIYLDNSATTPVLPSVREAMEPFFSGEFGNASSVYTLGNRARVALEEARETVARYIGAAPREITFTSSGTEANNTALKGRAFHLMRKGLSPSEIEVVSDTAEHHSVLHPLEFLQSIGCSVNYASVSATGHVMLDALASAFTKRTRIVSVMHVNNEVGAINRIPEIARLVAESAPEAVLHVDAVQSLGKLPLQVSAMNAHMLSFSAHKIHGPKGIGALYTRTGVEWEPLMHGGAQERNRRGGTEPVALAVGFAAAISAISQDALAELSKLRAYLVERLRDVPGVIISSATDETTSPAIVNFSFTPAKLSRLDTDALLIRFDLEGIAISNGSACTSGSLQPSHVLLAMGKGSEVASKSVRVSFSTYNTTAEIDRFLDVLRSILA
jgi:cysteine desulfurase